MSKFDDNGMYDQPMNFQHRAQSADIATPAPTGDYLFTTESVLDRVSTLGYLEMARRRLNEAQRVPGFGRGHALCLTKVQEAIFWLNQDNSYVVGT